VTRALLRTRAARLLCGASGIVALVAGASTGAVAQETRTLSRLDAATRAVVERMVDSARADGLPAEPLVAKALEGVSKGATGPRIEHAVRELLGALHSARSALGARAATAELQAGAGALLSGARPETLRQLRAARPAGAVTVPLVVLADLVVRGVPSDTASSAVLRLARAGRTDADLMLLRRNVEQDILAGAAPAAAATLRARAMSGDRVPQPPGGEPPERPPPSPARLDVTLFPFDALTARVTVPRRGLGAELLAAGAWSSSVPNENDVTGEAEVRLRWGEHATGAWLGAGARQEPGTPVRPLYGGGLWARWKGATITGELRRSDYAAERTAQRPAQTPRDTLAGPSASSSGNAGLRPALLDATDLRLEVRWAQGPLTLGLGGGVRVGAAGVRRQWGAASAEVAMSSGLALIASWGDQPFSSDLRRAPGTHLSVGVRMSPRIGGKPARASPHAPREETSFVVLPAAGGRHTLRATVSGARTVEIAGDFNEWQPLSLQRLNATTWETTLILPPGVYHLRLRSDGGAWMVPPGMLSVADGFGGEVGVVVIE